MMNLAQKLSTPSDEPLADYERVKQAIGYLTDNWRDQPSLDRLAHEIGLSPAHFQKLFTRWAGISPKEFLQALTLDHAKGLLKNSANMLDATYDSGLSSPGRLHDLFVTYEAVTPGEYKNRGEGLNISYGWSPSPFGQALVMATERGVTGIAFADVGEEAEALQDMMSRLPRANYIEDSQTAARYARVAFQGLKGDVPLRLHMIGSDFEISVWETLLRIPVGGATTYSDIARVIEKPKAVRAVGTAVGRNPISFVVPCHRVLGKGGNLCGYHWGVTRKKAILGWERGKVLQG
ncbi:MAG: bifunctional helix-turn-helix domain-containing protein/methylated-DNA--[protein]-cysteine S-methyltransferase [Pseudomonadota bacterium]